MRLVFIIAVTACAGGAPSSTTDSGQPVDVVGTYAADPSITNKLGTTTTKWSGLVLARAIDLIVEEGGQATIRDRGTIRAPDITSTEVFDRYGGWVEGGEGLVFSFPGRDVIGGFAPGLTLDCSAARGALDCLAVEYDTTLSFSAVDAPNPFEGWAVVEEVRAGEVNAWPVVEEVEREGRPYTSRWAFGLRVLDDGGSEQVITESLSGEGDAYTSRVVHPGTWGRVDDTLELRHSETVYDVDCTEAPSELTCASLNIDATWTFVPATPEIAPLTF